MLRRFFDDKAAAEQLLVDSGLDWTVIFPVNLKEAPAQQDWTAVSLDGVKTVPGLPTLPFDNVARTLVELAGDRTADGQRMLITTATGWKSASARTMSTGC